MDERQISTGQAAKISGLTIRTLQHYDNIGVLPASGRTEGGRRYYTEGDMMRLEHVVFYRGLGFTLEQIREKLLAHADGENGSLLERQKMLLYNQIYSAQNSIAAIEASQEIASTGRTPPWMLLATFMQALGGVDVSTWSRYEFSPEQTEVFAAHFHSMDDAMDFYMAWKRLSIKAAAFFEAGVKPDEPIARRLAADWLEMVRKATGGDEAHTEAYLEVDRRRHMWNPAERELIEKAEPFLEDVLAHYQKNSDV